MSTELETVEQMYYDGASNEDVAAWLFGPRWQDATTPCRGWTLTDGRWRPPGYVGHAVPVQPGVWHTGYTISSKRNGDPITLTQFPAVKATQVFPAAQPITYQDILDASDALDRQASGSGDTDIDELLREIAENLGDGS